MTARCTVVFIGLAALACAAEPEKPKPKFPFGKDLTLFTEPLDKDGYIDYETAVNERLRGKIKPDDNAVVLLMKALGPKPEGKELPPTFYKWLGTDPPPEKGEYLVTAARHFQKEIAAGEWEHVERLCSELTREPWKAANAPRIAKWVQANERPLAVVAEASRRPSYFQPVVAPDLVGGRGILTAAPLPSTQAREFGMLLQLRAMLHAGEGKAAEAWADVFTIFRLGRQVSQGGTLIELLVAIAFDHLAAESANRLLEHTRPAAREVRGLRDEFTKLPRLGTLGSKMALVERAMCSDFVQCLHRDGLQTLDNLSKVVEQKTPPTEIDRTFREAIDWEVLFDHYRQAFTTIDAAHLKRTNAERAKAWTELLDVVKKRADESMDVSFDLAVLRGISGTDARRAYTKKFAHSLPPLATSVQPLSEVVYRSEQKQVIQLVAFALAAYHADHKKYPATLADLAPKYIEQVPTDLFSGKPLVYKPSGTGYLLYSVGVNGADDGGKTFGDDPPGDDLRVQIPSTKSK